LFADRDYDEVSVDDVADAAGVSHGLVFQYFGSKAGFYAAVLRGVLEEFRRRVEPDEILEPIERLRAGLRANIEWAAEHPKGYRSMVHRSLGSTEVAELLEESRRTNIEQIAEGMGADINDPTTRAALYGWTGYIDQALLAWLESREPPVEELITLLVAALVGVVSFFPSDFNPSTTPADASP
jgi:AcrR family transcriptional regulator